MLIESEELILFKCPYYAKQCMVSTHSIAFCPETEKPILRFV
jgi:hypothetical protein